MPQRHNWHRDDEIIALDAYFRIQDGDARKDMIERAVYLVNRRTQRDGASAFNNYNSMRNKLQNIGHLQNPGARGTLPNTSRKNEEVWRQYRNNRDLLKSEMKRIEKSFR